MPDLRFLKLYNLLRYLENFEILSAFTNLVRTKFSLDLS